MFNCLSHRPVLPCLNKRKCDAMLCYSYYKYYPTAPRPFPVILILRKSPFFFLFLSLTFISLFLCMHGVYESSALFVFLGLQLETEKLAANQKNSKFVKRHKTHHITQLFSCSCIYMIRQPRA